MASQYSPLKMQGGEVVGLSKKEEKARRLQQSYDRGRSKDPTLETSAGLLSFLTMGWLTPFMELGNAKKLEEGDIPQLTQRELSANVQRRFAEAWARTDAPGRSPTWRLWRTIFAITRSDLIIAFTLKATESLLSFGGPLFLQAILLWLADENTPPWLCPDAVPAPWRGAWYVLALTTCAWLRSMAMAHQFNFAFRMAVQLRSTIIISVYQQSLRQALHGRGDMTTGKVVNLMASDANRLHFAVPFFHWFPTAFLQLIGSMYLLYEIIGLLPLICAVTALVCSLPLSYYSSKKQKMINDVVMAKRDVRVGRMSELLSAIKLIKSNAWVRDSRFFCSNLALLLMFCCTHSCSLWISTHALLSFRVPRRRRASRRVWRSRGRRSSRSCSSSPCSRACSAWCGKGWGTSQ